MESIICYWCISVISIIIIILQVYNTTYLYTKALTSSDGMEEA